MCRRYTTHIQIHKYSYALSSPYKSKDCEDYENKAKDDEEEEAAE